jgi:uncharacterized protein with HEPN domain
MSRHSSEVRLRHMLDHAREAVDLAKGKSRPDLANTRLLQLGLVRLVEIIGEAAARLPKEERAKYPAIPWEDVVGMRNRLIHGYDMVDLDILWNTVTVELPELIKTLEEAIPPEAAG